MQTIREPEEDPLSYAYISSIVWSPDGNKLATDSIENAVMIWDLTSGQIIQTYSSPDFILNIVIWNHGFSQFITVGADVEVRDGNTGERMSFIEGTSAQIAVWSSHDTSFALASGSTIHIFDAGGELLLSIEGSSHISAIAWNPQSSMIAIGDYNGRIALWDTSTGESLQQIADSVFLINGLTWNADGTILASTSTDGVMRFWSE